MCKASKIDWISKREGHITERAEGWDLLLHNFNSDHDDWVWVRRYLFSFTNKIREYNVSQGNTGNNSGTMKVHQGNTGNNSGM